MSGETNRLLKLAKQITEIPDERELDVIAATGEQVSVGLLALAIQAEGGKAVSLLGHQVRILTDSAFARARIQDIDARAIGAALDERQDRRHRRLPGRRQGAATSRRSGAAARTPPASRSPRR